MVMMESIKVREKKFRYFYKCKNPYAISLSLLPHGNITS